MSTCLYPETEGKSENTNNTVIQILRGMTSPTKTDWTLHLTAVEFAINPAVNVSTVRLHFETVFAYQPCVSPVNITPSNVPVVEDFLEERTSMILMRY